jgi:hypothetical protein
LRIEAGLPRWRRDEWRKQVMGVFLVTTEKTYGDEGDHDDHDDDDDLTTTRTSTSTSTSTKAVGHHAKRITA